MTTPASQPKLPDDYAVVLVQSPPLAASPPGVSTPPNELIVPLRSRLYRTLDVVFETYGELVVVDPFLLPPEFSPTFTRESYDELDRLLYHLHLATMQWVSSRGMRWASTNAEMHAEVTRAREHVYISWEDDSSPRTKVAIGFLTQLFPTTKWTLHDAT